MKLIRLSLLCLLSASVITSCVKKSYDNPPDTSSVDPNLPVTGTLRQFVFNGLGLQMGQSRVMGDTILSGIVIGDDRSGNIYKQIIIEDSSGGGLIILLDRTNLYGDYPVGRKVYIKTNGLYLTNYNGLPEIAYSVDALGNTSGIPSTLIGNYIVMASYPHTVTPTEFGPSNISDLVSNSALYLNTLVTLDSMQFDATSAGVPYSAAGTSTNRTITTCDRSFQIIMYNSSYATFQPILTPTGNGKITGILSIYRSTPQFTLRDTTDVHFPNLRCP